jgi:hypothetical protein
LALLARKVGNERLVIGTNLAGWDAPTEPEMIAHDPAWDANASRLLRLDRQRQAQISTS